MLTVSRYLSHLSVPLTAKLLRGRALIERRYRRPETHWTGSSRHECFGFFVLLLLPTPRLPSPKEKNNVSIANT